jgi:hypothetical protein
MSYKVVFSIEFETKKKYDRRKKCLIKQRISPFILIKVNKAIIDNGKCQDPQRTLIREAYVNPDPFMKSRS